MDFIWIMWSPWGVHGNLWGTVKYSNNLLVHIDVGIDLDQAFGAMPVVFPLMHMCHFIGLIGGM